MEELRNTAPIPKPVLQVNTLPNLQHKVLSVHPQSLLLSTAPGLASLVTVMQ